MVVYERRTCLFYCRFYSVHSVCYPVLNYGGTYRNVYFASELERRRDCGSRFVEQRRGRADEVMMLFGEKPAAAYCRRYERVADVVVAGAHCVSREMTPSDRHFLYGGGGAAAAAVAAAPLPVADSVVGGDDGCLGERHASAHRSDQNTVITIRSTRTRSRPNGGARARVQAPRGLCCLCTNERALVSVWNDH